MTSVISSTILRTQSDERLVALSRTGHQRAFEAIVERYRAELTRSVHRFLPSASVEDVLQQTHLEAWKALSGGTEVRELRGWLHRIARNAAIAVASRGYDYDELQDALLVSAGPEDELERREAVRRALRGIAELPERQREALLAVAVGGRSHAEVAFDLGITDTAARQLVRRARVSLLALATVMTPPQLVLWAARAGRTIVAGKAAAGGAGLGGSLTGPALKAGAVALAVGGVAAGVAPIRHALAPPSPPPPARHHHHHARAAGGAPVYLAGTLRRRAGTRGGPSLTAPASAPTGTGSARRHATHHLRSVSANPIGKTLPVDPGAAAVPSPSPATTPATPTPTAPAAAPATPNLQGLAALIAWAIAHPSQSSTGASAASFSWSSAGQAAAGQPGQPSSAGQSPQGGQTGTSGRCSTGSAGSPATSSGQGQAGAAGGAGGAGGSSTGCASSGGFPWTSSAW